MNHKRLEIEINELGAVDLPNCSAILRVSLCGPG